jgi:predicted MPP superfamily phosphohydrolase
VREIIPILFLVLISVMTLFTSYKLATMLNLFKPYWLMIVFAVLTFTGIYGMRAIAHAVDPFKIVILKIGLVWLAFFIFTVTMVLIYTVIGRFLPISERIAAITILLFATIFCVYGYFNAQSYKNITVEIPIENLPKELTIYHLSDVHLGTFGDKARMESLVKDMNKIKPDLVILNGDLVDGIKGITSDDLEPLAKAKLPVYFITGNHDIYVGVKEVREKLKAVGVKSLVNDIVELKGTQFVGLNYLRADNESIDVTGSFGRITMEKLLPTLKLDRDKPIIMIHHSPIGVKYMEKAGADLLISGHTHAGQIFPFSLLAAIQFKYMHGLYNYKSMQVYVSQGVGTFGPPIRLGSSGEASIIKLVPKKEA